MTYLRDLTLRLAFGAATFSDSFRQRNIDWLRNQQRDDGGFAGREGGSDLYYTGFALRSMMIMGALDEGSAKPVAQFLRDRLDRHETIIDLISLIFSAAMVNLAAQIDVLVLAKPGWRESLVACLEALRCDDGGYARSTQGHAGSTYQTFLILLCYQLLEIEPPATDATLRFLMQQEHPEGGFLEVRVGKRAGVNPTAAAIGALKVLDQLTDRVAEDTADFIADMQGVDGGLAANTRVPMADLLSTCTGMTTLVDLDRSHLIDCQRLRKYVIGMQRPEGGFAGFAMDPSEDVEYTFYGLATLALLATNGDPQVASNDRDST